MLRDGIITQLQEILQLADITLNGQNPWDIKIHNHAFFHRVMNDGTLGLGESYMDQWWDCEKIDEFFNRLINIDIENKIKTKKILLFSLLLSKFINRQDKKKSLEVGKKHYDLGNALFEAMLDKRMNYTCGYWKNATNLDDAQRDKLALTCEKLLLKPGMQILDIGCGFGALVKYAVMNYSVNAIGITISKAQYDYAIKNCQGLPIEIRFQDYREVKGSFDRIVSLGMFEHVGQMNYLIYMKKVKECLKDDGLFLLHTIGTNITSTEGDPWITKYIFPNSMLPSVTQIARVCENNFIIEDWHNFGADYDKTLMSWYDNFRSKWEELKHQYDDRFYRMWSYYLLSCAGLFRARRTQLWQIVLSKHGQKGGYPSLR